MEGWDDEYKDLAVQSLILQVLHLQMCNQQLHIFCKHELPDA